MVVIDEEVAPTEAQPRSVDEPMPRPLAAAPPPSAPARSWPLTVLVGLGGVLLGMLLVLSLNLLGGSGAAGTTGNPSAAWDSTYVLTDAYLTAQAKTGGNQIQDPRLHTGADGKVTLEGKVGVLGIAAPLNATLQPAIVDGKLQMSVVNARVGGLPLPGALTREIEKTIAAVIELPPTKVETTVVRIETKDGQLILYNKIK